jgi:hypothetical protein
MELPEEQPLPNQHVAFDVDDFEGTFNRLRDLGALDLRVHKHAVWELPDGSVQLYARDPAGNLLEVDWPDISTLDRDVVGEIRDGGDVEQSEDARGDPVHAAPPILGSRRKSSTVSRTPWRARHRHLKAAGRELLREWQRDVVVVDPRARHLALDRGDNLAHRHVSPGML